MWMCMDARVKSIFSTKLIFDFHCWSHPFLFLSISSLLLNSRFQIGLDWIGLNFVVDIKFNDMPCDCLLSSFPLSGPSHCENQCVWVLVWRVWMYNNTSIIPMVGQWNSTHTLYKMMAFSLVIKLFEIFADERRCNQQIIDYMLTILWLSIFSHSIKTCWSQNTHHIAGVLWRQWILFSSIRRERMRKYERKVSKMFCRRWQKQQQHLEHQAKDK